MGKVIIETVCYKSWPNCIKVSNGSIELIATSDVGPRIIYFGYVGGNNMFFEVEEDSGKTGGNDFRLYGGHRLWHAPQDDRRTCEIDNSQIEWTIQGNTLILSQPTDPWTLIEKKMEISMFPDEDKVIVNHRLINKGAWDVGLSAWAITQVTSGGLEIIPFSNRDTGVNPDRTIALWPWTNMNDPKVTWGKNYILIKQLNISNKPREIMLSTDEDRWGCWTNPFKIGLSNYEGWVAYINDNSLFVIRHNHLPEAVYTDGGSSFETYSCDYLTEMETLSPLVQIKPDCSIEHEETWFLYKNVEEPIDENAVDNSIIPLIRRTKNA